MSVTKTWNGALSKVRREIGVIPQANTVDGDLTALESLDLYARFYGMGRRERKQARSRAPPGRGALGLARQGRGHLLRRHAAPARDRAGLIHPSARVLPGRAHHGLDPQSRPRDLGTTGIPARERRPHHPHLHALHGEADRLCDRPGHHPITGRSWRWESGRAEAKTCPARRCS